MRKYVMFAAIVMVAGLLIASASAFNAPQGSGQQGKCLATSCNVAPNAAEMGCGNGKGQGQGGCNGKGACERKRDGSCDGQGCKKQKEAGQGNGKGSCGGQGGGQQKRDGSCQSK